MSDENFKESESRAHLDINDQNELDYEEDEQSNLKTNNLSKQNDKQIQENSDGEIKSENELDDGEIPSPSAKDKQKVDIDDDGEIKEENKQSEEEGEINDGEKVKKAFIPRVLCKYYQRGKCTWGRTCKFLHPGVNDTGNYTFLEFQDPTAKLFQQPTVKIDIEAEIKMNTTDEAVETESAWERGLRHAKEMKEKALRRKQMEKEDFNDKKMNLSLKEFDNEKEIDERYFNIENVNNADQDLEDEELGLLSTTHKPVRYQEPISSSKINNSIPEIQSAKYYDDRKRVLSRRSPTSRGNRADDWHDPWERTRQNKNARIKKTTESSSDSDSRSRSRSTYSSSYSSRSSSYSSRSRSPGAKYKRDTDISKSNIKRLPGRHVSDSSMKKAKKEKKNRKSRSRSESSSAPSYSTNSNADDSESESSSYSEGEDERKTVKTSQSSIKRSANFGKNSVESKKSKLSPPSKTQKLPDKDKKQMIKDQLKLLESALSKKKAMSK